MSILQAQMVYKFALEKNQYLDYMKILKISLKQIKEMALTSKLNIFTEGANYWVNIH